MGSRAIYNSGKWIGNRYNMLTVVEPIHKTLKNGKKQWFWRVKCDCGNERIEIPNEVISGKVKSCGCFRKSGGQIPRKHGESHTKLHDIWLCMRRRCQKETDLSYDRYGGRGIKVCQEWEDYNTFANWARANGYEEGLSIERKDVNGNYCPENCEWIPLARQARNRRTTMWVTYQGRKMSLAEAAEIAGLPYKQVHYRIKKRGWTVERALSEPMHRESELHKECRRRGINYHTVYGRIRAGWSEADAINTPILGIGANQKSYR